MPLPKAASLAARISYTCKLLELCKSFLKEHYLKQSVSLRGQPCHGFEYQLMFRNKTLSTSRDSFFHAGTGRGIEKSTVLPTNSIAWISASKEKDPLAQESSLLQSYPRTEVISTCPDISTC